MQLVLDRQASLATTPADSELSIYITNAVFRKFPVHVRVSFQSRAA